MLGLFSLTLLPEIRKPSLGKPIFHLPIAPRFDWNLDLEFEEYGLEEKKAKRTPKRLKIKIVTQKPAVFFEGKEKPGFASLL